MKGKRVQNVLLVLAWIGLIWMTVDIARDKPISEALWINIAYVVGLIAVAILFFVFIFPRIVFRFPGGWPAIGLFAIACLILIAVVEYHWLRDWVAQFF